MKRLEEYENAYRKLWFDSAVEADDSLWFAANNLNGIFKADKETGESKFITNFPQYPNSAVRLYIACTLVKRKIVFAPCNAREIAVYDIDKKELNTISLDKRTVEHCKSALFFAAFKYERFAYLIGMSYPGILKIDVETYEVYVIRGPFERYYIKGKYDYEAHFRHSVTLRDNILYLPAICENGLVCMNMENCDYEFLEILPKDSKAWDVCIINNRILTWSMDFRISNYDLETKKIKVTDVENDGKYSEEGAYLVPNGSKLWVFRLDSRGVLSYDIETGEIIEEIKDINSFPAGMNQSYSRYLSDVISLSRCYWDRKYWIFNSMINEFIRINDFGKIERKCFWADREWNIFEYTQENNQNVSMIGAESANNDLLLFMALIKSKSMDKDYKGECFYGKTIYKKVSSFLQEI